MARITNKDRAPYSAVGRNLEKLPHKSLQRNKFESVVNAGRRREEEAARQRANIDRYNSQKAAVNRDDFLKVYADAVRKSGQRGGHMLRDRSTKPKR